MKRVSIQKDTKIKTMYITLGLIFIAMVVFRFQYVNGDLGDSSLFQNIAIHGSLPTYANEFLKSIQVLIRRFVGSPNDVSIFSFPGDEGLDGALLGAHAYLNYPVISWFINLLGFRLFVSITAATSMILPLAIGTYLVSEKRGTKQFKKNLMLLALLFCYPSILWSGLGQFYPDRLFLIFFPLFLLVLERMKVDSTLKSIHFFVVLYLVNVTITERASIYTALVCGVYFITSEHHRLLFLASAIVSATWSVYYYVSISTDVYTSGFFDSAKSISGLVDLLFSIQAFKLLLFHVPGLILIRKMWDLKVILLLAMFPNVFGNIGGAEKVGWVTHYMTYLGATYVGVVLVYMRRKTYDSNDVQKKRGKNRVPSFIKPKFDARETVAVFTALALFVSINPNTRDRLIEVNPLQHSGILGVTSKWFTQAQWIANYDTYRMEVERIQHLIPPESKVGVSEDTAKFVTENYANVYMFPVRIHDLDFIVLRSAAGVEKYEQLPIVNYASPSVSQNLTDEAERVLLGRCFEEIAPKKSSELFIFMRIKKYEFDEECLTNG